MKKLTPFLLLFIFFLSCTTNQKKKISVSVSSDMNKTLAMKLKEIQDQNPDIDPCDIEIDYDTFYKIHNEGLGSCDFETLKKALKNFNKSISKNGIMLDLVHAINAPFLMKNNATTEPFKTIKQNFDRIDGVFIGFGRQSNAGRFPLTLYLGLVDIEFEHQDDSLIEHTRYIKIANKKALFVYKNGGWVAAEETEVADIKNRFTASYKGNRLGYYIGRNYFAVNQDKYIYLGYGTDLQNSIKPEIELVVTPEQLVEATNTEPNGEVSFVLQNYPTGTLSTNGKVMPARHLPTIRSGCVSPNQAACVRPCPQFCPD